MSIYETMKTKQENHLSEYNANPKIILMNQNTYDGLMVELRIIGFSNIDHDKPVKSFRTTTIEIANYYNDAEIIIA